MQSQFWRHIKRCFYDSEKTLGRVGCLNAAIVLKRFILKGFLSFHSVCGIPWILNGAWWRHLDEDDDDDNYDDEDNYDDDDKANHSDNNVTMTFYLLVGGRFFFDFFFKFSLKNIYWHVL